VEFSYYPGCSLHATAIEYDYSTRAVFRRLGAELVELPDWNCCGASSAHILNETLALALPARTLALAQKEGRDLVAPCAGCFNRLKTADKVLREDAAKAAEMRDLLGLEYKGGFQVRSPLDLIAKEIGSPRVKEEVERPLEGLKLVSYYGCALVRPPEIVGFEDPEHPQLMDLLLEAVGAMPLPWSYATECCGGNLALTRRDLAKTLVTKLVSKAQEAGAQAMVTACPLCQVNLEMRQKEMPIFYFTELIGLALGIEESKKWWVKHLIDPRPLLQTLHLSD
jgi:heterodisulfide reductase subunit B